MSNEISMAVMTTRTATFSSQTMTPTIVRRYRGHEAERHSNKMRTMTEASKIHMPLRVIRIDAFNRPRNVASAKAASCQICRSLGNRNMQANPNVPTVGAKKAVAAPYVNQRGALFEFVMVSFICQKTRS